MDYYKLENDEVGLYHSAISMVPSGKGKKANNAEYELLLTNQNFVFVTKTKPLFKKEHVEVEIYDINTIKFYRDRPHIIRKNAVVELYFKDIEKFIILPSKKEARIFVNEALRVSSGKSKLVRGVQKVQREIIETNEALGIDIVKIVVTTASIGLNVAAEVGGYEDAGKKVKLVGRIAKAILGKGKDDAKTIASSGEEDVQEIS